MEVPLRITDDHIVTDQPATSRGRRPTIVANPAGDSRFVARIQECLKAGPAGPAELEQALRGAYPAVVVRRREISNEPVEVWYAYREGRWTGRTDRA